LPGVIGIALTGEIVHCNSLAGTVHCTLDTVTRVGGAGILAGNIGPLPEEAFFTLAGELVLPLGHTRTGFRIRDPCARIRVTRVLDARLRTLIPHEPRNALAGEVIGIDSLARTLLGILDAVTRVGHARILAGTPFCIPEIPFFAVAGVVVDVDCLA
jgi:hypothetical protein